MAHLGSSQSGGTEQGVLDRKRDSLMLLMARGVMMMIYLKIKIRKHYLMVAKFVLL